MPSGLWNTSWLDENANRNYPLTPTATRTSVAGFVLPNDVLIGLILPTFTTVDVDPARFYVSSIVVAGNGLSISISYITAATAPDSVLVATASASLLTHTENKSYVLTGRGPLQGVYGHIQLGSLAALKRIPGGVHEFEVDAADIEPHCIRPTVAGVTGIRVVTGSATSPLLTGVISLNAGRNASWSYQTEGDGHAIRVDAIDGQGLSADCECDGSDSVPPPIRRINDVTANADGKILLFGNDCLQVSSPNAHQIKLEDVCSYPCCGARELERITQDLAQMERGRAGLNTTVERLEGTVNRFTHTVIGSRLNDVPCTTG